MAQSISGIAEHRFIRMPAPRGAGQGKKGPTPPEKQLNRFVRALALIERLGNALGTLAFTWATVVLLGGYPTVLRQGFRDFWCATIIVFLEAARMFSRNNRLDYQLFFQTKGAFRPLGWNGLIIIVYFSNAGNYVIVLLDRMDQLHFAYLVLTLVLLILVLPAVIGLFQSSGALKLLPFPKLRHAISLCSPLVAILLPVPLIVKFTSENPKAKWIVSILLFLAVLLLTINRLPNFPTITRLAEHALGNKQIFWHRLILNLCMFIELVMLVFMPDDPAERWIVLLYEVYALVLVSFGNLQIPAAVARVVLALVRLVPHDYYDDNHPDDHGKTNLAPSLNIFYGMVLGQGALYVVACMLEIFSFIPRKSLARHGELRGQWGKECVNLYYAYALEKSMEGDVLAPKKASLNNFAIYCLNLDTPKMQLHGIRVMHSLLLREEYRKQIFSKLITSTKVIARVIEMLDWSSPEDASVRFFAAKVTVELATSIRAVTLPGTVQVVSSLLDCDNEQKRGNLLLDTTDGQHEKRHDPIQILDDNHHERLDAVQDIGNLLETQEHSTQQVGTTEQQKYWIHTIWQQICGFWSIPQDEPLTGRDLLPALGMSILDGLVACDQDNCVEINRTSNLIPKIIGFTSYGRRSDTTYTVSECQILMTSSLNLLHSLTSIHGEIGITLRRKVSKNPFLLRNLADVLGDRKSIHELQKLVAGILRNIAIDTEARQAIGRIQVIIPRLMHAFLTPDEPSITESERLFSKVAGQALTMLAIDNVNNCLAMVRNPEYKLIKVLTSMIHADRYRYVAASLLQNVCRHARHEFKEPDLKDLSYSLSEVLKRIMDTDGTELQILIGLSSQICQVIPEDFSRELEHGQIKERTFVERLVNSLNANMEPSAHCPGIRRVILEQAINMMEYDSRYTNFFNDCCMMEALSTVEETTSDVENYILFMGDTGLIEASEPLPFLVARVKLMLVVH